MEYDLWLEPPDPRDEGWGRGEYLDPEERADLADEWDDLHTGGPDCGCQDCAEAMADNLRAQRRDDRLTGDG